MLWSRDDELPCVTLAYLEKVAPSPSFYDLAGLAVESWMGHALVHGRFEHYVHRLANVEGGQ
jgi:hypothetical protein